MGEVPPAGLTPDTRTRADVLGGCVWRVRSGCVEGVLQGVWRVLESGLESQTRADLHTLPTRWNRAHARNRTMPRLLWRSWGGGGCFL
jgi:hypothetical protein